MREALMNDLDRRRLLDGRAFDLEIGRTRVELVPVARQEVLLRRVDVS